MFFLINTCSSLGKFYILLYIVLLVTGIKMFFQEWRLTFMSQKLYAL